MESDNVMNVHYIKNKEDIKNFLDMYDDKDENDDVDIEEFFDPDMFDDEANRLFQIVNTRIRHNIKFRFLNSNKLRDKNHFIESMKNNGWLYQLIQKIYPNSSINQIYNYIKKKILVVYYNNEPITNYEVYTIAQLESFLKDKEYFIHDFNLVTNIIHEGVEIDYETLGYSPERWINTHTKDSYGRELQEKLDNVIRAQTKEISQKHVQAAVEHIKKVPNDNRIYLFSVMNNNNNITNLRRFYFSFKYKNEIIEQIQQLWIENPNFNYVSSNQIMNVMNSHTIDITVHNMRYRTRGRRNQEAGLFEYYYNSFKNQEQFMNVLKKCQIFTLEQINDEKNKKYVTKHCILNAIQFFFNTDEEKKRFSEMYINLIKKIDNNIYSPKKILHKLSNIINEDIGLIEVDEQFNFLARYSIYRKNEFKKTTKKIVQNTRVKIAIIKNHAFPIFNINVKSLVVKLLKEFPDYNEDLKQVEYLNHTNGELKIRKCIDPKIKPSCTSFELIREMFRENMFIKLTNEMIDNIIKNKELSNTYLHQIKYSEHYNTISQSDLSFHPIQPTNVKHHKISKECKKKLDNVLNLLNEDKSEIERDIFIKILEKILLIPKDCDKDYYIGFMDTETYSKPTQIKKGKEILTKNFIEPYAAGLIGLVGSHLMNIINSDQNINDLKQPIQTFYGLKKYYPLTKNQIEEYKDQNKDLEYEVLYDEKIMRLTLREKIKNNQPILFWEDVTQNPIQQLMDQIMNINRKKIIVYAHNLKFDNVCLSNIKDLILTNKVEKNGQIYRIDYQYKGKQISFIDSYKMISNKLSDFPKMFNLTVKKEYFPYKIMTKDFIEKSIITIEELEIAYNGKRINGKTWQEFISHIIDNKIENFTLNYTPNNFVLYNENMEPTNKFKKVKYINLKNYSQYYLILDIDVLSKGMMCFGRMLQKIKYRPITVLNPTNKILKHFSEYIQNFSEPKKNFIKDKIIPSIINEMKITNEIGFNPFTMLTNSSFADNFLIYKGCYQGCSQIRESLLEFIQESVNGGHTMTSCNLVTKHENNKRKTLTLQYINDYNEISETIRNNKESDDTKLKIRQYQLKHYKDYLSDYDAVSCYPSAMMMMDGFIKGTASILTEEDIEKLNTFKFFKSQCKYIDKCTEGSIKYMIKKKFNDEEIERKTHFFVRVKFLNNGSKSLFPLFKNELKNLQNDKLKIDNVQWENQTPSKEIVLDKYMLECIINTHNLKTSDYKIIYGVYFPEGYNPKINKVINELKEMRDKYKKEGNPLQNIVKLIMNSAYGKTILGQDPKKSNFIVGSLDKITEQLIKTNQISSAIIIQSEDINENHENVYKIEKRNMDDHLNRAHIGSSILGYSKLIMSKPKIIADIIYRYCQNIPPVNKKEINIYSFLDKYLKEKTEKEINEFKNNMPLKYTDTDSIMGGYEYIYLIMTIYKEIYGIELDGNDFGQFHIDFEMSNKILVNVFGIKALFLNKKEYVIILEGYNPKTQLFEYEEKFAYKGVPARCVIELAKKEYPNSEFPIFDLFSSNKIYEVDIVGDDGFKVSYTNRGANAESLNSYIKKLNFKQYDKTYDKFIKNVKQ